ncbi:K+/H+ antiporter subunit F [Paenalcaligenes hominis]|uniref:K+/H+ antiporter subunit F n=1 Tax=Paenalcaligenes hominis TaxID=643674 RepID=UPI0035246D8E
MSALIHWASLFALTCYTIGMVVAVYRLMTGPTAADRVLALDTIYSNGLMALLALGLRFNSTLYFDIGLLIALFGFVGSAAMAKFLLRGEVIEP